MAINTSSNSQAAIREFWETKSIEKMIAPTQIYEASWKKTMNNGNGPVINWVRFPIAAADTTPNPEGTIPTPEAMPPSNVTATLQQYVHGVTFSDLLKLETYVEGGMEEQALEYVTQKMNYTTQTLASTEITSSTTTFGTNVYAGNGAASLAAITTADTLKAADIRRMSSTLSKNNAKKFEDKWWKAFINSWSAFDLKSETGTGSFLELSKYTIPGKEDIDNGLVGNIWQTKIFETSLLPTEAVGAGGAITGYNNFFLSDAALGSVVLQGRNFKILRTGGNGDNTDFYNYAATIGGAVAANYSIVFKNLTNAAEGQRILRVVAASAL